MAQVVLRWHIQRGETVVAKTANRRRMAEKLDIFNFELNDAEMARIAALDEGAAGDIHDDPAFVKMLCGKWDLINAERALSEGKK